MTRGEIRTAHGVKEEATSEANLASRDKKSTESDPWASYGAQDAPRGHVRALDGQRSSVRDQLRKHAQRDTAEVIKAIGADKLPIAPEHAQTPARGVPH